MSKEFHVFTLKSHSHEQAFIFEVERHDFDQSIELNELWMITSNKNGELKSRIMFGEMVQHIIHRQGGNVDESQVSTIVDMFKDMLPEEKYVDLCLDMQMKEIKKINCIDLINAYATVKSEKHEDNKGTARKT